MSGNGAWGLDDAMAVCAVRYCLGRQTYVSDCCAWLRSNWSQFSANGRAVIQHDIERAIFKDDEARAAGSTYHPLGMDMDRAEWVRICSLWKEQE